MSAPRRPRVLRIAHHQVVAAWRERERQLRAQGWDVALLTAKRWSEGGRMVPLGDAEPWAHGIRTLGSHPNLFVYDPIALWRALGAKPDLVDIHQEPVALATAEILLLRALRGLRAPYLLYSAQNIRKRFPWPLRANEARALRHAAGAYVCNIEAGRILDAKGLGPAAHVIGLGVDLAALRPAERDVPGAEVVVGYAGRFEPFKGVMTLLEAAALRPAWRVRLIGDGPQRAELEQAARRLGVAGRTEFVGHLSGDDLAAGYRSFDVLVVPSIPTASWTEQFGRVAIEGMASGVPVVSSTGGALPEVVGDAGLLFAPGDAVALAEAVDRATEPAEWLRLRAAGVARAQEFTWERVAAMQGELYVEALGPDAAAAAAAGAAARAASAPEPPEVVVIAYGPPDLLEVAVTDLEDAFAVTVVDNSSLAETRALAERLGATYVDAGANLGFGAGVNLALRSLAERGLADRDVLLLNPDARIAPDAVMRMQRLLHSRTDLAAVGATQVDPSTGERVRVWWPFPSPARAWREAVGLGRLDRQHDFAIGSILMLRAEAVADVGGFDERFFLYAEETDWEARATARGWRIDVADVEASHIGGATSSDEVGRERLFFASMERYVRKHSGERGWRSFRRAMVLGAAVRAMVLPGERGRAAARRRDLFRLGPDPDLRDALSPRP